MEWSATAYRQTEKSRGWYAVMGLIVLIFVIYDLLTGGWIVSVTFLILAGVYYYLETKRVPTVRVVISDHGVRFGPRYFLYNQIKSFWILHDGDVRHLNLNLHKGATRRIDIIIAPDINIGQLRDYLLLQIVEEEGKKEPFSDQLIRNIGL